MKSSNYFTENKKQDLQHSKRMPFKIEEDEKLRELVKKFGENDWNMISKFMPHRSPRQCHDRWNNSLSSKISKEKWNSQEDFLLKQKYFQYGPKWKFFERFFPGRTSYNIKNRWASLVRLSNLCSEELNKKFVTNQNSIDHSKFVNYNSKSIKNSIDDFKSFAMNSNSIKNTIDDSVLSKNEQVDSSENQISKNNNDKNNSELDNVHFSLEINDDIFEDNYFDCF